MIERTQKRLRESEFFYRRLVACKEPLGPYKNEPDAFEFYLDAFVQIARTVPWVLQSEEKEKYEAWKLEWEKQLTKGDKKLLDFTRERRNEAAKEGRMETIIEWEKIDIYELLKVSSHQSQIFDVLRGHPAYEPHMSAIPGTQRPSINFVTPVFHFDREGAKEEATETCRKYL